MEYNWLIPAAIVIYFIFLIVISRITGKNSGNDAFFLGERKSPWYIVAYGMIGASLSGVTFISIPGWVGSTNFAYFQMVLGYVLGYYMIAYVLMPVYYKLGVTSIYSYLLNRFGEISYKTGATFFLISRLIGASFRLYLVAIVLEIVFDQIHVKIPFYVTVMVTVLLIWIYTNKGGIKTIIWTDTFQTTFLLAAAVLTLVQLAATMNYNAWEMLTSVGESHYSDWLVLNDINRPDHFIKYFFSGCFIAVAMTGLDQDMMQKNLSCRNVNDAKKNMLVFSWVLVAVNLLFLYLGAMLYLYSDTHGMQIPARTDYLYPQIALGGSLGFPVVLFFILGLIASAYSSADSALTALTTSFSVDIMDIFNKYDKSGQERIRKTVHIGMSIVIVLLILIFRVVNDQSVISNLMTAAGYTYGPLLGLFAFGLMSRFEIRDKWVPLVAVLSPVLTYLLKQILQRFEPAYEIGFEIILLNASLTFIGLILLRIRGLKNK